MIRFWKIQRKFTKNILKEPLYKPLTVTHSSLDIDMSSDLIDTCWLTHKSMIEVLKMSALNDKEKSGSDTLDKNVDWLSAVLLHVYFTQWLADEQEMRNVAEGSK